MTRDTYFVVLVFFRFCTIKHIIIKPKSLFALIKGKFRSYHNNKYGNPTPLFDSIKCVNIQCLINVDTSPINKEYPSLDLSHQIIKKWVGNHSSWSFQLFLIILVFGYSILSCKDATSSPSPFLSPTSSLSFIFPFPPPSLSLPPSSLFQYNIMIISFYGNNTKALFGNRFQKQL